MLHKNENLPNSGVCRSGWPQGKVEENKNIYNYPDLGYELKKKTKKTREHENDDDTDCIWRTRYNQ